jgi:hypothetical protein
MNDIAHSGTTVAHDSRTQVDGMLGELDALARSVARCLAELTQITTEVKDTAARAIRALQFEDIIGQLTGTVLQRIERLRGIEAALDGALRGVELSRVAELLAETRSKQQIRNVEQTSMAAGSIDLF